MCREVQPYCRPRGQRRCCRSRREFEWEMEDGHAVWAIGDPDPRFLLGTCSQVYRTSRTQNKACSAIDRVYIATKTRTHLKCRAPHNTSAPALIDDADLKCPWSRQIAHLDMHIRQSYRQIVSVHACTILSPRSRAPDERRPNCRRLDVQYRLVECVPSL